MHTALFAAVGLAISVSVAGFLPGTPGALPGPVAVVQPEESGAETLGIDLPGGTLEEMLNAIAEATGERLFVHWQAIEGYSGFSRESEVGPIPSKDLDSAKVRQLLNSMLGLEGDGELTVRSERDLLEVATRAYFDAVETVTVDYDVSKLVPAKHVLEFTHEGERLQRNIQAIVEPDCWMDNGGQSSLTFSGSVLSVRAPERIHAMVAQYIAKLEVSQRTQEEQAEVERQRRNQHLMSGYQKSLAKSEELLVEQQLGLGRLMTEFDEANLEYWKVEYARRELEERYKSEVNPEARAEQVGELARLGAQFESLKSRQEFLSEQIRVFRDNIHANESQISMFHQHLARDESAAR